MLVKGKTKTKSKRQNIFTEMWNASKTLVSHMIEFHFYIQHITWASTILHSWKRYRLQEEIDVNMNSEQWRSE